MTYSGLYVQTVKSYKTVVCFVGLVGCRTYVRDRHAELLNGHTLRKKGENLFQAVRYKRNLRFDEDDDVILAEILNGRRLAIARARIASYSYVVRHGRYGLHWA